MIFAQYIFDLTTTKRLKSGRIHKTKNKETLFDMEKKGVIKKKCAMCESKNYEIIFS